MLSIQSVSVWKILGTFLILTLCQSGAWSGDDNSLPSEQKKIKRVRFADDTKGGKDLPEEVPAAVPNEQEQNLDPASVPPRSLIADGTTVAVWASLFSVPFVKNAIVLGRALFGELPSYGDCYYSIIERTGLVLEAVVYPTLKTFGAFLISLELAGVLGNSIYSKILNFKDIENPRLPQFIKKYNHSSTRKPYELY